MGYADRLQYEQHGDSDIEAVDSRAESIAESIVASVKRLQAWQMDADKPTHEIDVNGRDLERRLLDILALGAGPRVESEYIAGQVRRLAIDVMRVVAESPCVQRDARAELGVE